MTDTRPSTSFRRFRSGLTLLACVGGCLLGAGVPARAAGAEEAEQLRIIGLMAEAMRARLDSLPVLLPADVAPGQVKETAVTLNAAPVVIEGQRFDAVVIHTPVEKVSFAWAFAGPANVSRWYVLRETGDMRGFRDFVRRPRAALAGAASMVPLDRPEITLQKLDAAQLSPNTGYILWFAFKDDKLAEFTIRAAWVGAASVTNARLPGVLFPVDPAEAPGIRAAE